jgi:hypothetical protein
LTPHGHANHHHRRLQAVPQPAQPAPRGVQSTGCSALPLCLIDLPSFDLQGKASLFAACRLSDMKMGQLVSFELAADQARFERRFVPD